jgi:hypothetical protein
MFLHFYRTNANLSVPTVRFARACPTNRSCPWPPSPFSAGTEDRRDRWTRRSDGHGVGDPGTAVAGERESGIAVAGSSPHHHRHPLEAAHRRPMAHGACARRPVAPAWDVGLPAGIHPDDIGRRGGGHVGGWCVPTSMSSGPKLGRCCGPRTPPGRTDDHASHRGCAGRDRPLAVVLTPSQCHDRIPLVPVLDAIRVPRPGGRGRPRKRPDHLIGDTDDSYPRCRRVLRRRGMAHTIPERDGQRAQMPRACYALSEKGRLVKP